MTVNVPLSEGFQGGGVDRTQTVGTQYAKILCFRKQSS